ncbi:MAG TPA: hypothetical protein VLB04_06325 [Methanotrichaceae archaeon]|nr:hypothetical protein [Methanotrichaceae archaeon]
MRRLAVICILLALLSLLTLLSMHSMLSMLSLASASPDEFSERVVKVKDGDSLLIKGIGNVRLADINSYQLPTPEGQAARKFTEQLLGKRIHLDIDDMGSRCPSGCHICVLYVEFENGSINPVCFNRMLVDAGHAVIADRTDNEFDPADWWKPGSS